MSKIEDLNSEQIAKLPEYAARWTAIGLSTEPANRARSETAIRIMYARAGLAEPRIVWANSPLSGALVVGALRHMAENSASVGASVRDSVRDSVGAGVGDSVGDRVGASVWDSVSASVCDSVWDSVWDSVRDSVWDSVRDSVWASVGDSVGDSVWDSVRDSVWDSVRDSAGGSIGDSIGGAHEAHWLGFYSFFRNETGLRSQTQKALALTSLSKNCGWIFPYQRVCIATERHSVCRINDAGQIHCEDGPAIAYPDGFEIYAFNGVRLDKRWVLGRKTIDPLEILAHQDVEIRAAGAACVGWPRMLDALDVKTIDRDPNPDHGELIEVTLPGLPRPGRFLKAECPRNGTIVEGIPPEIDTVLAAQAWRVGKDPKRFSYPERRT